MRTKMTPERPDVALNRVLAGLEKELVGATDEEIVQAAAGAPGTARRRAPHTIRPPETREEGS